MSALAAVVREGSFDKAAIWLGVTPSAVSQRIKGLEERVGAILVTRGIPCAATETGARLCAHVEQVRLLESEVTRDLPTLPGTGIGSGAGPSTLRVAVNADSMATWFPLAATLFAEHTGAMLDLVLEDEAHTNERLKSGEVLAAVTSDGHPVNGCRCHPLGAIDYMAVASPSYMARHFPDGVQARALEIAPILRFDRRDALQARWAREVWGVEQFTPPTHWVPSTPGMLDLTLSGLGWSMTPVQLARPQVESGRLVELSPASLLCVPLYWQRTRLEADLLQKLTRAVRTTAAGILSSATPET